MQDSEQVVAAAVEAHRQPHCSSTHTSNHTDTTTHPTTTAPPPTQAQAQQARHVGRTVTDVLGTREREGRGEGGKVVDPGLCIVKA